jgi:hypothetical protein
VQISDFTKLAPSLVNYLDPWCESALAPSMSIVLETDSCFRIGNHEIGTFI